MLGIRYKIDLNLSNNSNRLTSHNRKLRTKPFWRISDQVVRAWFWSMGRHNKPWICKMSYGELTYHVFAILIVNLFSFLFQDCRVATSKVRNRMGFPLRRNCCHITLKNRIMQLTLLGR